MPNSINHDNKSLYHRSSAWSISQEYYKNYHWFILYYYDLGFVLQS